MNQFSDAGNKRATAKIIFPMQSKAKKKLRWQKKYKEEGYKVKVTFEHNRDTIKFTYSLFQKPQNEWKKFSAELQPMKIM